MKRLITAAIGLLLLLPADAIAQTTPAGGAKVTLPGGRKVTIFPSGSKPAATPNTYEITGNHDPNVPLIGRFGGGLQRYYTVRRGDTLWGICTTYFRNPWLWPRIWSYNPSITNPHWIYPGDRIMLRPDRKRTATRPKVRVPASQPSRTVYLRQRGFLVEEKLKSVAKIIGSREEKIMLATHDVVYVKYPAKKPLKVGERYSVYKVIEVVKHPHRRKRTVGRMVEVLGELEVQQLTKANVARAVILRAVNPIERGNLVGKLRRVYKAVTERGHTKPPIVGSVIAVLNQAHLIGTRQLTFIDRGKMFGVKVGHVFFVVRQGDGYRKIAEFKQKRRPADRKWPREYVAKLIVVEVGYKHSVAYVVKAIRVVKIGDKILLHRDRPASVRVRE